MPQISQRRECKAIRTDRPIRLEKRSELFTPGKRTARYGFVRPLKGRAVSTTAKAVNECGRMYEPLRVPRLEENQRVSRRLECRRSVLGTPGWWIRRPGHAEVEDQATTLVLGA